MYHCRHLPLLRLYGYKWFSSATDSDMSMTLARVEDREGGDTSDKLSMFYLETRDDQGQPGRARGNPG